MMNQSVFLSTLAIYFFLFGMFLGIRKIKTQNIERVLIDYPLKKLFRCYLVVTILINSLSAAIWAFPGLVQYFYHLFEIKWGFYAITFYKVHKSGDKKYRLYLYLVIIVEFTLGLSSFFANSFLNILFFTLIAIAALQPKLKIRHYITLLLVVGLIFHFGVLWTVAKKDYRQFINKGTISQSVEVTREEAISHLFELVQKVDAQEYQNGIKGLVFRIGYTYYFSLTLNYVPRVHDFEYGKVYTDAILFFLTPRFLFPDKEVLDDSQHLTEYTGQHFNGAEAGASFSLGYVPDAYIDFGPYLMFVPVFAFGLLFGVFYSFLYRRA
ncbi:MAG: hypothetical protein JST39_11170, partial [Bacteroidetes bacterium]|nr:hypothetical protein [Bacteroidota bacterium]